jgi:hypothetical protein
MNLGLNNYTSSIALQNTISRRSTNYEINFYGSYSVLSNNFIKLFVLTNRVLNPFHNPIYFSNPTVLNTTLVSKDLVNPNCESDFLLEDQLEFLLNNTTIINSGIKKNLFFNSNYPNPDSKTNLLEFLPNQPKKNLLKSNYQVGSLESSLGLDLYLLSLISNSNITK